MNQTPPAGCPAAMALVALAALALAGCATFSADGGFGTVENAAGEHLGGAKLKWIKTDEDARAAREAVAALLAKPVDADAAVQVALLNNRSLQATYAELGIAEADLVQAGRIGNPRYTLLRTNRGGDVAKAEEAISLELVGILTLPLRTKLEAHRFRQVQAQVAREMLGVALETRRAWIRTVTAEARGRYLAQVLSAAEAAARLAQDMAKRGNFSKLTQLREEAFRVETAAELARAQQTAVAERERLVRLMGLDGADAAFALPERLPDLPASLPEAGKPEAAAIERRYDVQAAQRETEAVARALGLTRATRFVNVLELGRARTKERGDPYAYGYEISLEIPLFDWGTARVAKAEAIYLRAVNRLAAAVVDAASEVREASAARRAAYGIAHDFRQRIVPLRKEISDENLLRYNGMLISVFELLADAREQVASVIAAIGAERDYWLADADLAAALTGATPGPGGGGTRVAPTMAMPAGEH